MAFRYCYSALSSVNNQSAAAAAARVSAGVNDNLKFDMAAYNSFFNSRKSTAATNLAAGLGVMRALAPRSALRADRKVHDRDVRLDAEHGSGKLGVAGLLTACVLDLDSRHGSENSL